MKQLRILGRSIRDAFKSVFRNFSLSMASISCITITLLIVAISMVLSYNIENISTLIKKDFSIVVFVENNATDEDIKNIKEQIEKLDNIDTYTYETKEEVANNWKNSSDIFKVIIRSQIIQLCGFRNTIYHCAGRGSFCSIVEHPVFLAKAKGTYSSL